MATKKPDILSIRGSAKAAEEAYRFDRDRRTKASQSENKGRLLDPNEVKGEYDVARMLMTTLNSGVIRPLTHEDLQQFRHNVKVAGKKYKGGITVQQVINLSSSEDRDRANKQIHMAVPAGSANGKVRFVTNSGPESKVSRHYVEVQFNDYEAAIGTPLDPKKLAFQLVKKSNIKLQCDCQRFTFWLRYIATIGGFVLGRAEKAYPKIRNPGLSGVACKHLLRVMKEIDSNMAIRNLLAQQIDKAQREEERKHVVVTQEQANKILQGQQRRKKEITVREARQTSALKRMVAARKPTKKQSASAAQNEALKNLEAIKATIPDAVYESIRKGILNA